MSAQQARDRKKLYVSELEERVAQLEKEVSTFSDLRNDCLCLALRPEKLNCLGNDIFFLPKYFDVHTVLISEQ